MAFGSGGRNEEPEGSRGGAALVRSGQAKVMKNPDFLNCTLDFRNGSTRTVGEAFIVRFGSSRVNSAVLDCAWLPKAPKPRSASRPKRPHLSPGDRYWHPSALS